MEERWVFNELRADAYARIGALVAEERWRQAADLDKLESEVLHELNALSPNFKYIVSAATVEQRNCELWQCVSAHWSNETDGAMVFEEALQSAVLLLSVFIVSP